MLGGYQILDLRKIDLTITKTQSNITNAYVLSQLLKLRDFIDKDYDFSKPIENQLKPVLIRYRDKKNGEKNEGAMFGELAIVDNYYTFQITGRISGYLILTIKVAFQEITNAYGAKEWVINTAKIKLQDVMDDLEGNLALEGDLSVSGDLSVGGDVEIVGDLEADKISGNEIVEKMTGYSASLGTSDEELTIDNIYSSVVKNGNKLTIVAFLKIKRLDTLTTNYRNLINFDFPSAVNDKLYPIAESGSLTSVIVVNISNYFKDLIKSNMKEIVTTIYKRTQGINLTAEDLSGLDVNEDYYVRIEQTFTLSDNLVPQE